MSFHATSPAVPAPIAANALPAGVASNPRVCHTAKSDMLLIANPHSGGGRARRKVGQLLSELKRRGIRPELSWIQTLDEAASLSRRANLDGRPLVVAVGGDGTINRVMNGFFDRNGKRLADAVLGIVHLGSSPDFCRSYGIPTDIPAAVEALLEGYSRPVRVGRVSFENQTSAIFGCCANAGLGAEVARFANSGIRRRLGDMLGTFFSLLRALHKLSPRRVRLEMDGVPKQLLAVNLAVGRTRYVASGLKVNHALDGLEPRLYVLALTEFSWGQLGHIARVLYGGRPVAGSPCFTLDYARAVQLTPLDGPLELEFDGDPAGWCPCTIHTAPDPLDVITQGRP